MGHEKDGRIVDGRHQIGGWYWIYSRKPYFRRTNLARVRDYNTLRVA
jgi:hypothetical protein